VSTAYEIPITPGTPQTFAISLAGVFYNLTLRWSTSMAAWFLDLADASNNPLLNGVPLVTGADLLEQYGYLGIGGKLVVQSDTDLSLVPSFSSLGDTGHLYFVTTP
jgi:hypothetical protein